MWQCILKYHPSLLSSRSICLCSNLSPLPHCKLPEIPGPFPLFPFGLFFRNVIERLIIRNENGVADQKVFGESEVWRTEWRLIHVANSPVLCLLYDSLPITNTVHALHCKSHSLSSSSILCSFLLCQHGSLKFPALNVLICPPLH